jgi:hypothetical protein
MVFAAKRNGQRTSTSCTAAGRATASRSDSMSGARRRFPRVLAERGAIHPTSWTAHPLHALLADEASQHPSGLSLRRRLQRDAGGRPRTPLRGLPDRRSRSAPSRATSIERPSRRMISRFRSARVIGPSTASRCIPSFMRKSSSAGQPTASSSLHAVSRSASWFMNVTRPMPSVTRTASPRLWKSARLRSTRSRCRRRCDMPGLAGEFSAGPVTPAVASEAAPGQ